MRYRHKCKNQNCTESFKWPMQLNRHKKECKHKPPDIKYVKTDDGFFKCNVCCKTFKHQSGVSKHVKKNTCKPNNTPTEKKSYVCSTCGKEFVHQCRLNQHMKSHDPVVDEGKVCANCKRQFKRIDFYQKHVEKCSEILAAEPEAEFGSQDESMMGSCSMVVNVENSLIISPENSLDLHQMNSSVYAYSVNNETTTDGMVTEETNELSEPLHSTTDSNLRNDYYREYRQRNRKKKRLESICGNLSSPVKANVVKDLVRGTPRVLNEIYTVTESNHQFENLAISSVISHLKSLSKKKKYGTFYKLLDECFRERLQDEAFANWLIDKKLGLRTNQCLPRLAAWKERGFQDTRGRSRLPPEVVKKVYTTFVNNSVTSTDGRNGRNMVMIRKQRYYEIYNTYLEHSDVKIEEKESRKKNFFQSNRRILTCTILELRQKLQDEGINVCMGKLIELKPFFIAYPTDKELALCLCKLCLNARLLLDVLVSQAKKDEDVLSDSVTNFVMGSCPCDKGENGYYQWKCVQGKCKDCKYIKPAALKCSSSHEQVQVSQFETTKTPYTKVNKETGAQEEKVSEKTERVVSMRNLSDVYSSLAVMKTKYLMHRYQVSNDKHQWPKILSTTDSVGPVYHLDYSENLTQSYKYEPQSSHFNKKQYSLHCTVKHLPNSDVQYLYHFSDTKKHDFAYTSYVVDHLLDLEDEDCFSEIVRVKSDNCCCQYKCCYIFSYYQTLAKRLDKTIIVYYGVCGHGKGLVDAMSAFGVKTPLRRAVVTKDFKYNSADEIRTFLEEKFSADFPEKQYYTIEPSALDDKRQNRGSLKIKNCQAQHMISYFPNGQVQTKVNLCSCDKCMKGDFIDCRIEKGNIVEESEDDEEIDDMEYEQEDFSEEFLAESVARVDTVLDAIAVGNVIALLTASQEPFFLCKVLDFGIATAELGNREKNNFACEGEQYIACHYFDVDKKKKVRGKVFYKLLDDDVVYINPATVFALCVNMDSDMSLSSEEFQWLCDSN